MVTDHVERPQKASGPAAALIVIGDDPLPRVIAQSAEQRLESLDVGKLARSGLDA